MSDLLSAASLFLAVLGLLYSAWYGEIRETLDIPAPDYKPDRGPVISKVKVAYYTRALPLVVGAATVSIILFPGPSLHCLVLVSSLSGSGIWRDGVIRRRPNAILRHMGHDIRL